MSKISFRKCVVCRRSKLKSDLIRLVVIAGKLTLDSNGAFLGRGAYLDRDLNCIIQAGAVSKWEHAFRLKKGELSAESVRQLVAELTKMISNRQ